MADQPGYTVLSTPFAYAQQTKTLYFLSVFEIRNRHILGRALKTRVHTLTKLRLSRLLPTFERTNARAIEMVLDGEAIDAIADRLLINLEKLAMRRDGAASVEVLSGSRLDALLGFATQVMATRGLAAFADESEADEKMDAVRDITTGSTVLSGSLLGIASSELAGVGLGSLAGKVTLAGGIVAGGAVVAAGGAGALLGWGLYKLGGDDLGDAVIDWILDEDGAPDPGTTVTAPQSGDPDPGDPQGGDDTNGNDSASGDGGTDDDDSGGDDDDEDDDTSDDDDTSTSSDSDDDADDDTSGDEGTDDDDETPSPEDQPEPLGALILYFATGLGAQEYAAQRRAFDIHAGADIGAPIRDAVNVFEVEDLLASMYLKLLTRQVETQINKYGALLQTFTLGPINPAALTNYGLITPTFVDLAFFGQTSPTVRLRTRIR